MRFRSTGHRLRVLRRRTVTLTIVLAPGTPAAAQSVPRTGVIDGVVTDSALLPLGDATVSFIGSNVRVVTGANGRFRVRDMNPGAYVMIVRRIGFEATSLRMEVSPRDTARPALVLQRTATTLNTVAIRAQRLTSAMQEFEARRELGFGHFITQAEIDKRGVVDVSDLLTTVPSVMIKHDSAMNRRTDGARPCPFQLFIDGVKLPPGTGINSIAVPKELAGIEIYSGAATIPLQYKPTSGSFCGVILLWTRIGS
jgi:hypothetical protein